MDTAAHGFLSYLVGTSFRSRVRWPWLVFFGMWPDLVWLPFTALSYITSGRLSFFWGPYNVSHSLVIWVAVSLLLMLWRRNAFAYTWPWALHILVDVPGHLDMPTPILWPISTWHINGWFDWLKLPLWLGTYGVLFVVLLVLWRTGRIRSRQVK